jgi:hypothetical protein
MKVNSLHVDSDVEGSSKVVVWCVCTSVDDIVDLIAWLKLAQQFMEKWEQIRKDET